MAVTANDIGKTLVSGQLVPATIAGSTAGGRILQLSLDSSLYTKTSLGEVSNIASILPGHLVSALITAVVPSGLNLKVCGFFDGTIDLAHLNLKGEDIDEKYKIGKKVSSCLRLD
jgi:rRNA biogenesis protein RRP5